jgi:hypothetical protein
MSDKYKIPDFSKKEFFTNKQAEDGKKFMKFLWMEFLAVCSLLYFGVIYFAYTLIYEELPSDVFYLTITLLIIVLFIGILLTTTFILSVWDLSKFPEITKKSYNVKILDQTIDYIKNVFLEKGFDHYICNGQIHRFVYQADVYIFLVADVTFRIERNILKIIWMHINICIPKGGLLVTGIPTKPIIFAGRRQIKDIVQIINEIQDELLKIQGLEKA